MGNANKIRLFLFIAVILLNFFQTVHAQEDYPPEKKVYWSVLGGYGCSTPGWGGTKERVKTFDNYLRFCNILVRNAGESWYKFNHELWIEFPWNYVTEPDVGIMTGTNFLAAFVFNADPFVDRFIYAGGGPLSTTATIPGMGSKTCGNYMFGGGVRFQYGARSVFNIESRFHHISNMGMFEENVPINSVKILAGVGHRF